MSDRKNISIHLTNDQKTERNFLIEKKKNYSDAIRERNVQLKTKKKSVDMGLRVELTEKLIDHNIIENLPISEKKRSINSSAKKLSMNRKTQSAARESFNISALDFEPIPKLPVQH